MVQNPGKDGMVQIQRNEWYKTKTGMNGIPAGTIRWINVELKFKTTSRRYFNYISTLFQCQMPAGTER